MAAKRTFDTAIKRAEHFLTLYALLHDNRKRDIREDWAKTFKKSVRWPVAEKIHRIDGKNSLLILRENSGLDRDRFQHEYVSELLRSAIIAAVSALDRYLHDLVVDHSWNLLRKKGAEIPKELRQLKLPILQTIHGLDRLRKSPTARPGTLIKQAIQEELHKIHTFQSPSSVSVASQMLGIKGFWDNVAKKMPNSPSNKTVQDTLKKISIRRNQIVHEADLIRKTRSRAITLRDISERQAEEWVGWIKNFVNAIDKLLP